MSPTNSVIRTGVDIFDLGSNLVIMVNRIRTMVRNPDQWTRASPGLVNIGNSALVLPQL